MHSQRPIPNGGNGQPQLIGRLRIAETFISLQGEGLLTGTRSFFIRTSGCNLRCWFCDTPYASWQPEGETVAIDQLVENVIQSGCRHLVLTGGEPLLPIQVPELVRKLHDQGLHVTIETAGTLFRPVVADLMSISPKLLGSGPRGGQSTWSIRHEQTRWRPDVIRQLIDSAVEYQIKFVVDQPADFEKCVDAVEELAVPADHTWIMPQGIDDSTLNRHAAWLRPLVDAAGFHYCDRMQVKWYGNQRGT